MTIVDFRFDPGSVTVHVGDTVTWTNGGPSPHTATANNGSFNTGVLKKGASASHTFTQPGTFTYYCQVHPFMHATVVVLAASTTSTTPSSPTSTAPSSPTTSATAPVSSAGPAAPGAAGTLPSTGLDLAATLATALGLVGLGLAMRRAGRPRERTRPRTVPRP